MRFLDPKEEVIKIKITPYGKYLLSMGKFNPAYYAFFDNDILYDSAYTELAGNELQNDIENRILNETPRLEGQTKFEGAETTVFTKNSNISNALDQTKKLERALTLMKRYGRGDVGITDELIRGVKVVWAPKPPDIFKMQEEIEKLKIANESLFDMLAELKNKDEQLFVSFHDTLSKFVTLENSKQETVVETSFFDWEIKTGFLAWSAGAPYDLAVPSVGILLRREYWAFDLEGGFTPWSRKDELGKRGDAMLMGSFAVFPRRMLAYKAGIFSGWEFLSKTDNWTMKVLGVAAGPSIKWKIFEGFGGYSYSRLSTLYNSDRWVSGFIFHFNIKFLVN